MRDHNTDPGDPNNGTTSGLDVLQLPDDSECDDTFVFPSGKVSAACRELSDDPACDDATAVIHAGTCNSPSTIALGGDEAPPGSAFIQVSTAIDLLTDTGVCRTDRPMVNGQCIYRDYGEDCLPCTDDDVHRGMAESLSLTTGTAQAAVYDAGNVIVPPNEFPLPIDDGNGSPCGSDAECGPGQSCRRTCDVSGAPCDDDGECPNDFCRSRRCEFLCGGARRCLTARSGAPFDCDALLDDPGFGLSEGVLAVSFSDVDTVRIGDSVTASLLAFERGTPEPTPTATPTALPCPGDCDRSGGVRTDDLVTAVGIAWGRGRSPPVRSSTRTRTSLSPSMS